MIPLRPTVSLPTFRGICYVFLLTLFSLSSASAQPGRGIVTGRAADTGGGALQGARIELQPGGASTVSNNQGEYRFTDIPAGAYKLTVSFVGFTSSMVNVTVAPGQTSRADVTLQVASTTDSVLVTAERPHGEAEAINRQRTAENILQVLPHDVITSLPNANVADAIGRLPSVTLERDEGEGKYVQIRGTEPRYSNVTIDGVNVPSPETVRTIKLDIIPSDLVESVEINKTLLANMDGDAIGGSVNLRTKIAGEQPTISMFGLGGYTPIVNGRTLSQFGGTIGKRFGKERRLGLIFGGTYDWNGRGIDDIEPALNVVNNVATYSGTDIREYRYYRARWGFSGSADYKLSQNSQIYIRGLYSHFDNFGDRWVYSPNINDYLTPFLGDKTGDTSFNASVRRPVQVIGSLSAGGQHFFRTSWISWEVAGSRASTEDKGYSQANFAPPDGSPLLGVQYAVDLSNPYRPRFPVTNGVNILDLKQYLLQGFDNNTLYSPQVNLQGAASVGKNYSWNGHFGVFEFGGKFRTAHKFNEPNDVFYTAVNPNALPAPNFPGDLTNSNYYGGSYQFGPTVNYNKFRGFVASNPSAFTVDFNTTRLRNDPNVWDIVERVGSGYFQNAITFGKFRLYTGLRFEATDEGVRGAITHSTNGKYTSTSSQTTSSGYLDPLPSAQLRYALTSESGIRFAYGRGIARPDFFQLPPYLTLDDTRKSVSVGNPNLKPTHANNYDVLYEHYLKPLGLIQAGYFYKDISDPIARVRTTLTSGTYAGFKQTQYVNITSAHVAGFEIALQQRLSYLPGLLNALGISANYSYTTSQATGIPGRGDKPSLLRQAPHTWNISPTYDKGRISLRVGLSYNGANIFSYGYTDGADLGIKGPNGDQYLYAHLQVDAQASIRLAKGFSAIVYGLNLNNEVFGFYQGSPIYVAQREYYKTTYAGGLRWSLTPDR
jgi:TonB-dependent receptor